MLKGLKILRRLRHCFYLNKFVEKRAKDYNDEKIMPKLLVPINGAPVAVVPDKVVAVRVNMAEGDRHRGRDRHGGRSK